MEDRIWQDIMEHRGISKEEIPALELYMDQVIRFMESRLSHLKTEEADRLLTKTMINNYVKAGIVQKPHKKRYSPSQLMALIMVFHLKNIIPLQHISTLFSFQNDGEEEEKDIEKLYEQFLSLQELTAEDKKEILREPETEEEKIRLILHLLIEADLNKRMAERLIEDLKSDVGGKKHSRVDDPGKGKK